MKILLIFALVAVVAASPLINRIGITEYGAEVYHKKLELVPDVSVYESRWFDSKNEEINGFITNGTDAQLGQFP